MVTQGPADSRKAPYAPVKAMQQFLERMRAISVPERVDRRFLQRVGVARSSEWALLSALKFLRITDDAGIPTPAYRRLQTDRWRDALRDLVTAAYRPLLEVGGLSMSNAELRGYFSLEHSASQAANAARLFRDVCELSGLENYRINESKSELDTALDRDTSPLRAATVPPRSGISAEELMAAKRRVLDSLPQAADVSWSAEEYLTVFDRVLEILRNLDNTRD